MNNITIFDGSHLLYRIVFANQDMLVEDNWDFFRYLYLNSIFYFQKDFRADEVVIALDDINNWRKKVFPEYKAQRKSSRKQDDVDWKNIFGFFNKFILEMAKYFPFKVIKVKYAEADDIIGIICKNVSGNNQVVIISGDKDFRQLLNNDNIHMHDPIKKKRIKLEDYNNYLIKHILQGDNSDNIPDVKAEKEYKKVFLNFLDDPVENYSNKELRKKEEEFLRKNDVSKMSDWKSGRIGPKTAEKIIEGNSKKHDLEKIKDSRQFKLNKRLIDLTQSPEYLQKRILKKFNKDVNYNKKRILKYFKKFNMDSFIEQKDKLIRAMEILK